MLRANVVNLGEQIIWALPPCLADSTASGRAAGTPDERVSWSDRAAKVRVSGQHLHKKINKKAASRYREYRGHFDLAVKVPQSKIDGIGYEI